MGRREVNLVEEEHASASAREKLRRMPGPNPFRGGGQTAQVSRRKLRETHVDELQPVRGRVLRDDLSQNGSASSISRLASGAVSAACTAAAALRSFRRCSAT